MPSIDLGKILRQAEDVQAHLTEVHDKVSGIEAVGEAGAGLVKVTMNGKLEIVSISIDQSLMNGESEIVEDLVKTAHKSAQTNIKEQLDEAYSSLNGGLGGKIISEMKLPF